MILIWQVLSGKVVLILQYQGLVKSSAIKPFFHIYISNAETAFSKTLFNLWNNMIIQDAFHEGVTIKAMIIFLSRFLISKITIFNLWKFYSLVTNFVL